MARRLLPAYVALLAAAVVAVSPAAARHRGKIDWHCTAARPEACDAWAITAKGRRLRLFHGPLRSPGARWHGDRLGELRMSCGSPCTASVFVDVVRGQVSSPLEAVLAVDHVRQRVAVARTSAVEVIPIFGDATSPVRIVRPFAPVAALASAIEEATFVTPERLRLRYLRGETFAPTDETVDVPLPRRTE